MEKCVEVRIVPNRRNTENIAEGNERLKRITRTK